MELIKGKRYYLVKYKSLSGISIIEGEFLGENSILLWFTNYIVYNCWFTIGEKGEKSYTLKQTKYNLSRLCLHQHYNDFYYINNIKGLYNGKIGNKPVFIIDFKDKYLLKHVIRNKFKHYSDKKQYHLFLELVKKL